MSCLETYLLLTFIILFILPSFCPYNIPFDGKYFTTVVCDYDDVFEEVLQETDSSPEYIIGNMYKMNCLTVEVRNIIEYWYEGLEFDTRYFIVKVVSVK